jgi:hypothetical protein
VILLKWSVSELPLEIDAMTVAVEGPSLSSPPRTPLPGTQLRPRRMAASCKIRTPVALISVCLLPAKTAGIRRREGWIEERLIACGKEAHDLRY